MNAAVQERADARVRESQADDNAAMIRQYLSAISGADKPASVLDRYLADAELKQHIAMFEAAFPRYAMVAEDVIAQGDKVVVRARFQGTHGGDLMGMAATQRTVDVPFMIIYRIADSKVVEHWMSIDRSELLEQLRK